MIFSETTFGNSAIINQAVEFVRDFSECLLDDSCPAVEKEVKQNNIARASAKKKVLAGALRVFIGVHPDKTLKSLGIDSAVLVEVGQSDNPTTFWAVGRC